MKAHPMRALFEVKLVIACPGCGVSRAVVTDGLCADAATQAIAEELVERFSCWRCGYNNLHAYLEQEAIVLH